MWFKRGRGQPPCQATCIVWIGYFVTFQSDFQCRSYMYPGCVMEDRIPLLKLVVPQVNIFSSILFVQDITSKT